MISLGGQYSPGWFWEQTKRWQAILPGAIEETLRGSVRALEDAAQAGHPLPGSAPATRESLPFRITTRHEPGQGRARLGVEVLVGRQLWLWGVRRALEHTLHVLRRHRWTILSPPKGWAWFTSDDPFVRLNFSSATTYNFGGGWGSPGTEIFLPLGPQHLLYTRIGHRPPRRGERMAPTQAAPVRRFIAEHAHRMIFAAAREADVPRLHEADRLGTEYSGQSTLWSTRGGKKTYLYNMMPKR